MAVKTKSNISNMSIFVRSLGPKWYPKSSLVWLDIGSPSHMVSSLALTVLNHPHIIQDPDSSRILQDSTEHLADERGGAPCVGTQQLRILDIKLRSLKLHETMCFFFSGNHGGFESQKKKGCS